MQIDPPHMVNGCLVYMDEYANYTGPRRRLPARPPAAAACGPIAGQTMHGALPWPLAMATYTKYRMGEGEKGGVEQTRQLYRGDEVEEGWFELSAHTGHCSTGDMVMSTTGSKHRGQLHWGDDV